MKTETKKPIVKLIGTDVNIFSLVGKASKEMKRIGMTDEAKEMADKVFASASYSEALSIIGKYVTIK
jgi:hypothetical protein